MPDEPRSPRRIGGAVAVGAGIFLSRIAGLVREFVLARYLGLSKAAGAFRVALRIPNILQNLLGEGVLSASLIPIYARLRKEGRDEEASEVARAVGTLLALAATVIAALGVLLARPLVGVIAWGFEPEYRELSIELIRILFPGIALLVGSAWCLGVLNSHRKFFLPYVSPVLWNIALIAASWMAGHRFANDLERQVVWVAWGVVVGSAAQFLVQLPSVVRLLGGIRPSFTFGNTHVKEVLHAFVPIVLSRGSVQISAFIDQSIASSLGESIVAGMSNAQTLYLLPVSLFGMSISASELPEMSESTGDEIQKRLRVALRRVVFLVVPSAVAFVAIGGPMIAMLFQHGRFTANDTAVVWLILSGSAIGLSAGTQGRVLNSALYAIKQPRLPLYAALVRIAITGGAGYLLAIPLRDAFGYSEAWGAFGLTASAGVGAWIEFVLLDIMLSKHIGKVPVPAKLGLGCLAAAALAGAAGFGVSHLIAHRMIRGVAAIAVFGIIYLGIMSAANVPEAGAFTRRLRRRRQR
ncbi:MAG: murein biosynthesis integral membrane protein MurJ [Deltaproteobacteria bacterium]|nr:murein biosynthesis integral membrane protein MurJ [Deltaproteobacteria bacterium]